MGRYPKYLTHAARTAAKRAQHARYSQSDRGKATRAKGRSKLRATAIAACVEIPGEARTRAAQFSLISPTYMEVHGPDLGLCSSPYTFVMPDLNLIAAMEENGCEPLELKLRTLQARMAWSDAVGRMKEWSQQGLETSRIIEAGVADLKARVRAWNAVERDVSTTIPEGLREVYLDWGAKRLVELAEELEVRQKGVRAYNAAAKRVELPSQLLNVANMRYLESLEDEDKAQEDCGDLFTEEEE
ncbi:hypothetical protein L226DRAFT_576494 [Lentinus tigrinus ALCF2SS1-7]|uniref:Uncharacterized protein n=1 Tax=Lentinus tigrinus ALCF2SS1-6 TaxID=1328759 RepID=A0A5C2RQ15_9APHY|nr:hypothetical protein L227DRAFT_617158 [Lentinus tigrinus ALCF2SS1-6]RPD68323.1 hypothetical protein L226DRAFT_576494 [Lentinus tigrinus ALCF2SS1-7]